MEKLITIPDDKVKTLQKKAIDLEMSFKKYIEHIIVDKANFIDLEKHSKGEF